MANPIIGDFFLGPSGTLKIQDIPGPGSYSTGGVTVSAAAFGLLNLLWVDAMTYTTDGTMYVRVWSPTGPGAQSVKVQWYLANGTEATNGSSYATKTIRMIAIGT
jgi:hypothetical protein